MAPQDPNGPRHEIPEDGDPLLVRPYILRDQDPADTVAAAWPSGETWPSASLKPPREIISHRAGRAIPLPGGAAPPRRRRTWVIAGAGAAAVLGVAAADYGLLSAGDDSGGVPIPAGALPPLPALSATSAPSAVPTSPSAAVTTSAAAVATSKPAAAGTTTAPPATPAATATTTAAPVTGETTTAAPVPPTPGLVAALSPAPPAARIGTITGDGNLCLDLNGGVPADDNHVQVFACNGTEAQRWTLATDGTLRVVGKCAQVTGDSTVHIIGCDNRAQAQWRTGSGGTLVNIATGECLTDPDGGSRSGAGVRVSTCADAKNQVWSLP